MADWTNDLTSWHHKWEIERSQLCLVTNSGSDAKYRSPWSSSTRKKFSNSSADVQARLWSSPIPSDVGIRCLVLSYFITGNVDAVKSVRLSLLQHHDVHLQHSRMFIQLPDVSVVFLTNTVLHLHQKPPGSFLTWTLAEDVKEWTHDSDNWLQKWVSQIANQKFLFLHAIIFHRSRRSILLLEQDFPAETIIQAQLSKPLLTWTLSEDLEEWANDGENWLQKWRVSSIGNQSLVCLQAKPTHQNRQPILLSRKKDATKSNIRARLLSPPIPSDLNLRCLVITYAFTSRHGLQIPKGMRLILLQRQKGCLCFNFLYRFPYTSLFVHPLSIQMFRIRNVRRALKGIGHHLSIPKTVHCFLGFCLSIIGATSLTCDFENGSLCEWGNDLNNWLATWRVESSALCFKPLRQYSKSRAELLARLYSPFLSEESAIGCVKLSYIISVKSSRSDSIEQSARLSLMQKQMGKLLTHSKRSCLWWRYFLGVADLFSALAAIPGGRTSLFSCDFESAGIQFFCGWNIDPRDSGAMWSAAWSPNLHTNMLCLTPTASESVVAGVHTDGNYDNLDLSDPHKAVMRAKFWSPKFRLTKADALFTLSLSLLLDRTSLNCAFENGSICEWTNDPNNWFATWKVLNSLLCLRQHRPASGKQTKLSARLYSPFLTQQSRIGCVKLNYAIFSGASLNCTFDNGSLCAWSNDQSNWLATWEIMDGKNSVLCLKPLRIPSEAMAEMSARLYSRFLSVQDGIGCLKFSFIVSLSGGRSNTQLEQSAKTAFVYFLSEVSASLFACDFEMQGPKSLCGWKDDPRDNGIAWSIVWNPDLHTNILCMTLAASSRYGTDNDENFGFGGSNDPLMRAKLWSPKFHAVKTDPAPQCVKFSFRFDQLDVELSSSLSLMRHSAR
ncbi:unnamed protein product [Hydatigera taeniaeformis]|uniref:MAM domain-containing protein n=1 Tax=Hydatigena taeniaeformis TaxID=6205 RepID=A0A3P7FNS8_HYDTA|nr:unnamed protein product [Hydatigera taeniaeformis]